MSAGLDPKGLNPLAVEAMREFRINISGQESKAATSLLGQHFPYVVTVLRQPKGALPNLSRNLEIPALELRRSSRSAGHEG